MTQLTALERRFPTTAQRVGYTNAFRQYLRRGMPHRETDYYRALELGTDTEGGFAATEDFSSAVFGEMESTSFLRQITTVLPVSKPANLPYETDMGEAVYEGEEDAIADDTPALGRRLTTPFKASSLVKASEELLNGFQTPLDEYLGGLHGRRFAAREERSALVGTGSGQPTGLASQAAAGVTAASPTAIAAADINGLYGSLGSAYLPRASWVFSREAWQATLALNLSGVTAPRAPLSVADLHGRPVYVSGFMAALEADAVPVLFGDFSNVVIATGNVSVLRLSELYVNTGQVGFRAWLRHDIRQTVADAVRKLTMAAS